MPGYEGVYSASSLGCLRSKDRVVFEKTGMAKRLRGRPIVQKMNRGGYFSVELSAKGIVRPMRMNRIVAETFLGLAPSDRHEVCHIDGNRANNCADNLRWDTRAGNFSDKVLHGTHNRGQAHPLHRLSNSDISAIRLSASSNSDLSLTYAISPEYIGRIRAFSKRRYG